MFQLLEIPTLEAFAAAAALASWFLPSSLLKSVSNEKKTKTYKKKENVFLKSFEKFHRFWKANPFTF